MGGFRGASAVRAGLPLATTTDSGCSPSMDLTLSPGRCGFWVLPGARNLATRCSSLGWRGDAARLRLRDPDAAPVRTARPRTGVDLRVRPDRTGPATHRPRAVGREL